MLREVGNIGAGNASKALSEMTGEKIEVDFPSVDEIEIKDIAETLGCRSDIYSDVSVNMDVKTGDEKFRAGHLLLLMDYKSAKNLGTFLTRSLAEETTDPDELEEKDEEALKETANILTGASVSAITEYVDLELVEGLPSIKTDMLGAILDNYLLEIAKEHDHALVFRTEFTFADSEVDAYFLILFRPRGREVVLERMEM
ncbi:MAG: chemotaxis protein CheC [Candidatus Nanohaloarchaea archaeon]|nr:chemotaxis protein CheC [Candidatus Nanohaloarchaea archaeon]